MAQIYGSGTPVNTGLPDVVDYDLAFASFGLLSRHDFKAANITRADVAGTSRASAVSAVTGANTLSQATDLRKPAYVAGGGPSGLTDALTFARARGDRLDSADFVTGDHTRAMIIKATAQASTGVNGILHGTNISGDGRNSFYIRWNAANTPLLNCYIGQTSFDASVSIAIPHNTWVLALQSWDASAREIKVGYRAIGDTATTWSAANVGEAGTAVTQVSSIGLGSSGSGSDGFEGQIAGMCLFDGYAAHLEADLLLAIEAWACGDNSIFGL